ncbi:MAG: ribulose-phosphate 3-epimerase [Bacteroidales bacterium]|nr:ribulose-phosphate 3-epimerase [Bacteroidales bacterium]
MKPLISPSLLSADFAHLAQDIEMLNDSASDLIHLDIMDGVFVPNISFGFPVIKSVKKYSKKPLDVHLMIVQPEKFIQELQEIGIKYMTVHYEACLHLHRVVQQIREAGMSPGVSINPATPISMLKDILPEIDLVLLMSVNPGFGGQAFIPHSLQRMKELKELRDQTGSKALIEVDGGINLETGFQMIEAGADILVAGSAIFSAPNPLQMIQDMKNLK